jgi:hypothetical protein
MTIEQRKIEFHKELQALLKKFDAELTIEETGVVPWTNEEIVVDFLLKETDFPNEKPGANTVSKAIIAGSHTLKIGRWLSGETD